jgi:hypothetical protein
MDCRKPDEHDGPGEHVPAVTGNMTTTIYLHPEPLREETEDYCLITLHDESTLERVPEEEEITELDEGYLYSFTLRTKLLGWIARDNTSTVIAARKSTPKN